MNTLGEDKYRYVVPLAEPYPSPRLHKAWVGETKVQVSKTALLVGRLGAAAVAVLPGHRNLGG